MVGSFDCVERVHPESGRTLTASDVWQSSSQTLVQSFGPLGSGGQKRANIVPASHAQEDSYAGKLPCSFGYGSPWNCNPHQTARGSRWP